MTIKISGPTYGRSALVTIGGVTLWAKESHDPFKGRFRFQFLSSSGPREFTVEDRRPFAEALASHLGLKAELGPLDPMYSTENTQWIIPTSPSDFVAGDGTVVTDPQGSVLD